MFNNYGVRFKRTEGDHDFLDIRDVRNGEVYCFYKRLDEENYTFGSRFQEHSLYSIKGYNYDSAIPSVIYHDRPACPFEYLKEYKIKIKQGQFSIELESIKEIDEVNNVED